MTRLRFPADRTAFVYQGPYTAVLTLPRTGIMVYADAACTIPANILDPDSMGTIPGSIIYSDDGLIPEFLGADDAQRLWIRFVGSTGPGRPVDPTSTSILTAQPPWLAGEGFPDESLGYLGAMYLDLGQHILYGPKDSDGWPPDGFALTGDDSGSVVGSYVYTQTVPAQVWTIDHPLTFKPNVVVLDSAGNRQETDIYYPPGNPGRIVSTASAPFAGTALLS